MDSKNPHRLCLPARSWRLGELREFCQEVLRPLGLEAGLCHQIILAIDEAAANVIEHAYPARDRDDGDFELLIQIDSDQILVEIHDRGVVFQPPNLADLEICDPPSSRRGYGLRLIQQIMDRVEYTRTDHGENILRLVKNVQFPQLA